MAVISNQADSKLKLVLNAGVDINNKTVLKNKTLANVKAAVLNEDLYNLGVDISGLQDYTLANVVRYDEYELMEVI